LYVGAYLLQAFPKMNLTAIETQISLLTSKLQRIEVLLDKDFEQWSMKERNKFGSHEQLREEKQQLRGKEFLLLKEKQIQGIGFESNSSDADFGQPKFKIV
jgi:hypothetical protein